MVMGQSLYTKLQLMDRRKVARKVYAMRRVPCDAYAKSVWDTGTVLNGARRALERRTAHGWWLVICVLLPEKQLLDPSADP